MQDHVLNGDGSVETIVRVMRLLSDPTRLKLLALLEDGERNVSELCEALDAPQPTVSHHLSLMRSASMVTNRRSGKQVYYQLNRDTITRLDGDGGLVITAGPTELLLRSVPMRTETVHFHAAVG